MQQDKTLLPFGNYQTLAQFQYERLKPFFSKVFLSSKTNKFDFLLSDSSVIYDQNSEIFSPLVALQTILKNAKAPYVFILTADTPFVKVQTIQKLMNQSQNYDIVTAKTATRAHPLCGVFSKTILPIVERMLQEDMHKIGYLLQQVKSAQIAFDDENEFLNLNTPQEYEKALKIISKVNN
jgi:molybdopterin-guanine dinucleotide biosynthesis protein A